MHLLKQVYHNLGCPIFGKNKVHCALFVPILDNFWLVAAQGSRILLIWLLINEIFCQKNLLSASVQVPLGCHSPCSIRFFQNSAAHMGSVQVRRVPIYLKYHTSYQWEFQDPKMEVLYHIRPYFGDISPYKAQKHRRFSYGRSLQSSLVPGQHGH